MSNLILPNSCVLLLRVPLYDQDHGSPERLSNFSKITNDGKPRIRPSPGSTPYCHNLQPQERWPGKIAQPALKISSRPCPQKSLTEHLNFSYFCYSPFPLPQLHTGEELGVATSKKGEVADRDCPRTVIEREQFLHYTQKGKATTE